MDVDQDQGVEETEQEEEKVSFFFHFFPFVSTADHHHTPGASTPSSHTRSLRPMGRATKKLKNPSLPSASASILPPPSRLLLPGPLQCPLRLRSQQQMPI